MTRVVALEPREPLPAIAPGGITPLDENDRQRHAPDRHLLILNERGQLAGRGSCWWSRTPALQSERIGLLGHYAVGDAASANQLLQATCETLARAGCTVAIGPMDGNTWRRYRWIVERGTEPPFFLEPDNPDSAPAEFVRAGFDILATYTSAVSDDLSIQDPRLGAAESRLIERGIRLRPLDLQQARDELRAIYRLSLDAFSRNYLYTPIAEEEFLQQNEKALPFVDPDLVLLAERDAALVGYLFGVPDVLERARGGHISTYIVKTVAVASGSGHAGLGSLLVGRAQQLARTRGYRRVIHALMHERNVSQNISGRYARTMRRYALYSRRLRAAPA
jgi:GNAT superfamily N-acetyltransferase